MRTAIRFIASSFLSLIILCGAAHAQKPKKYPIRLDRPRHVGQTYVISSVVTTRQQLEASMKGSLIKKEDTTYVIRFLADATVTDRDPSLGSVRITYKVRECLRIGGSDTIILAPAGTELYYVKASGDKNLTSKDGAIDQDALDDIDDAITEVGLGAEGMGYFPPKAVGEKWDIGKSIMTKSFMEGKDLVVPDKGVKAMATLTEVSESAATPSMKVRVDITLKDFKLRQLEQFKIAKSNALISFVGDLPLDETKGPQGVNLSMNFTIKASGKPDPELPKIDMEMRFAREAAITYSYR